MTYNPIIDPNKWIKISNVTLEDRKLYWCKMTNGRIVMATPYSNGYSSGMAKCIIDDDGVNIKTDEFYMLKDSFVQPVITI